MNINNINNIICIHFKNYNNKYIKIVKFNRCWCDIYIDEIINKCYEKNYITNTYNIYINLNYINDNKIYLSIINKNFLNHNINIYLFNNYKYIYHLLEFDVKYESNDNSNITLFLKNVDIPLSLTYSSNIKLNVINFI